MFYQTPNSDSTILIAFAIIAGIVFAFVVVATIILLRFENKKEVSQRTNNKINSTPPVEIIPSTTPNEKPTIELPPLPVSEPVTLSPQEEEEIIDLPFALPVEIVAASSQKESPNNDLPFVPPVETATGAPPEERPSGELPLSPKIIGSLWGIFLTTALMFAFTLAIIYFIHYLSILGGFILLIGLPFGIALAGTVGVRVTHLEWRLMFVPVLLLLAGLALLMTIPTFANSQFLLLLAAIGGVFVLLMNREGKEVSLSLQSINWFVCFIVASMLAFWGYLRLRGVLGPPLPIPAYFYWFAIILTFISPACLAIAWLRLTGTKWRTALFMIPSMPVGVLIIFFLTAVTSD